MRRIMVDFQGERVEGEELDWTDLKEAWNEYQCADGSKIKVKTVVQKIVRLSKRNPDGEPIYLVNSSNVVTASVPQHLMIEG